MCGTTRDTLGKEWIRSVTWSTLRLVAPFRRLLYRYANERNVALGKHGLAVWSCCRVTVCVSIDPIGSLFLSIEVHETCVCGITFALVLRALKMSAAGLVRDWEDHLWCIAKSASDGAGQGDAKACFSAVRALEWRQTSCSRKHQIGWMVHWQRRRRAETFDDKSILRVSSAVRLLNVLVRLLVLAVMLASFPL